MGRDTRRWCRGKEGVEHLPVFVRRRPEEPQCHRVENWRSALAEDDPKSQIRWYNAPWECRHTTLCDRCGKRLDGPRGIVWELCPDLPISAEGRELLAAREELSN